MSEEETPSVEEILSTPERPERTKADEEALAVLASKLRVGPLGDPFPMKLHAKRFLKDRNDLRFGWLNQEHLHCLAVTDRHPVLPEEVPIFQEGSKEGNVEVISIQTGGSLFQHESYLHGDIILAHAIKAVTLDRMEHAQAMGARGYAIQVPKASACDRDTFEEFIQALQEDAASRETAPLFVVYGAEKDRCLTGLDAYVAFCEEHELGLVVDLTALNKHGHFLSNEDTAAKILDQTKHLPRVFTYTPIERGADGEIIGEYQAAGRTPTEPPLKPFLQAVLAGDDDVLLLVRGKRPAASAHQVAIHVVKMLGGNPLACFTKYPAKDT